MRKTKPFTITKIDNNQIIFRLTDGSTIYDVINVELVDCNMQFHFNIVSRDPKITNFQLKKKLLRALTVLVDGFSREVRSYGH